jgi:hypothetical protein
MSGAFQDTFFSLININTIMRNGYTDFIYGRLFSEHCIRTMFINYLAAMLA